MDFSLLKSILLQDTDLKIVGGHYCSLQNQEAAQLRLINPEGAFASLYEVPYDKTAHGKDIPSITQGEHPLELYARCFLSPDMERARAFICISICKPYAIKKPDHINQFSNIKKMHVAI